MDNSVETHRHRYQEEGGWRFELNEVKLDEERAFLVIESALRAMGIIIIKMDLSLQYKEAHFGRYMNGNSPYEKLKSLLPNVKEDIAIFPPFILDKIILIYQHIPFARKDKKIKMEHLQPGHALYVQYTTT